MKNTDSILQMARGAFVERVDYEMHKVIDNILDPNTKATAKRKITLTIELVPDDERQQINVQVTAKSTLAPPTLWAPRSTSPATATASLSWPNWCPRCPGKWPWTATNKRPRSCFGWPRKCKGRNTP